MQFFKRVNTCAVIIVTLFLFALHGFQTAFAQKAGQEVFVLKGGTLIDLSNFGRSSNDIVDAVVVIEAGKIKEVGKSSAVTIPANSNIINVKGHYILPGLIDGFATINNQSYANAFLYNGVTTIVGLPHDDRRGELFMGANPSPKIMLLEDFQADLNFDMTGAPALYRNKNQINALVDSLADKGVKVLWIGYETQTFQLPLVVAACNRRGLATIAELSTASYREAIKAGVQSFVHTMRYSADFLPDSIKPVYKENPFGAGVESAKAYYESVSAETDMGLHQYAEIIGRSKTGLIPTFSLIYSVFPFSKNPWKMPAASLVHPDSVHLPLDIETGKWKEPRWSLRFVSNLLDFEEVYHNHGAKFLTGSGTDAFGTLPGVSMHSELEMLVKAGLSNREALAAATTNFSEIYHWNEIGQVKKGAAADILVLSKNPVESLENLLEIKMLLLNGKVIDRESLLK